MRTGGSYTVLYRATGICKFNGSRDLGVPTPWITVHTQNVLMSSNETIGKKMESIVKLVHIIFFVLAHVQDTSQGVHRDCYGFADYRINHTLEGGKIHAEIVSCDCWSSRSAVRWHLFYILKLSGVDYVLGFLALRRGMEILIQGGNGGSVFNKIWSKLSCMALKRLGYIEVIVVTSFFLPSIQIPL